MKTQQEWTNKGKPIPSPEAFMTYQLRQGEPCTRDQAEAWVAEVEAMKTISAAKGAGRSKATIDAPVEPAPAPAPAAPADPVPAADPAPAPVAPVAPAAPVIPAATSAASMRHRQAKADKAASEIMSVRVWAGLGYRLGLYAAKHQASKQDVVSDVLDEFLTREGF